MRCWGRMLPIVAFALCAERAQSQPPSAHWVPAFSVPGVVDLAGPRRDGTFVVAAAGRLLLLDRRGTLTAFAADYATRPDTEPYVALARAARVRRAGCAFRRDDLFALDVAAPGVVRIDAAGAVHPFVMLPAGVFPNGITFDHIGRFDHRVLVTAQVNGTTTLFAIDCRGGVDTLAAGAPVVEGGIAVAPRRFGRHGGRLIAPDELSGRVLAFDELGRTTVVAESGLDAGPDIGVESIGFVPPGLGRHGAAYVADRGTPGNPHPGTDSILALDAAALARAGVRAGDLLAVTEGGAETVVVRCRATCTVRRIGDGPAVAHGEGHVVFRRAR